jgi:hypothetical protein
VNEHRARIIVRARSGGICEVCRAHRAESFHHRKNRSQGGRWDPANGLDTCGDGTRGCHGRITRDRPWALSLGYAVERHDDPAGVPVWSALYGRRVLLDSDGCLRFETAA